MEVADVKKNDITWKGIWDRRHEPLLHSHASSLQTRGQRSTARGTWTGARRPVHGFACVTKYQETFLTELHKILHKIGEERLSYGENSLIRLT